MERTRFEVGAVRVDRVVEFEQPLTGRGASLTREARLQSFDGYGKGGIRTHEGVSHPLPA